ncbi:MAG: Bax inhibitor 1 family protein, partial [Bacilli bacterium]
MYGYSNSEGRSIKSRVFLGLFATLLSAGVGTYAGQFIPPAFYMPLVVGELVLFFAATFLRRRKAVGWTFVLGFTLISGMTLTPILVAYTQVI